MNTERDLLNWLIFHLADATDAKEAPQILPLEDQAKVGFVVEDRFGNRFDVTIERSS